MMAAVQLELPPKILQALSELLSTPQHQLSADELELETTPIAGVGENAYGLILRTKAKSKAIGLNGAELNCILKIAPKNPARRSHMNIAASYAREVFMYDRVFREYRDMLERSTNTVCSKNVFHMMPLMYHYSLDEENEFIIFEDLAQANFVQNSRIQMPTYELTSCTLQALATFHALSFALQAKEPSKFEQLIAQLQPDNLFTPDVATVTIEFGKSYIRRTRNMLEAAEERKQQSAENTKAQQQALLEVEEHFKEICLHCVNGKACAPYAVICHGDFWNNNILYKYETTNTDRPSEVRLIDFQMSRYASPILDLIRYLFVCIEPELRNAHFQEFLYESYYQTLEQQLRHFDLDSTLLYSREIFESQLHNYGVYGLCMAAFSIPFFIAETNELHDLDEVSKAIVDLDASKTQIECIDDGNDDIEEKQKDTEDCRKLVEEEYDLLTERNMPIFRHRMFGIIADVVKYEIKTKLDI